LLLFKSLKRATRVFSNSSMGMFWSDMASSFAFKPKLGFLYPIQYWIPTA
jgi:hypothetical protein